MKELNTLMQEVIMYRTNEMKPNYSELARIHKCDRRTIKSYFEDKRTMKKKKSKLDKYEEENIGSESNLRAYIIKNK